MILDLTGKTILVTGASRGIGRAIATSLGEAGARVAVHYRSEKSLALEVANLAGNDAQIFHADLTDVDACVSLFAEVVSKMGPVHVLVNNAGRSIESPLTMTTEEFVANWDTTMTTNLRSAGVLSRLAIQHFRSQSPPGGRLIHIASRAAFRGDTADYIAYAASKGGIVAMSRSIARAYGKDGICSFIIAPGFVRTAMAQEFMETYGEDYVGKDIALQTLTTPEDVAPMVVMLASGKADHATGTTIDINAGSYVH